MMMASRASIVSLGVVMLTANLSAPMIRRKIVHMIRRGVCLKEKVDASGWMWIHWNELRSTTSVQLSAYLACSKLQRYVTRLKWAGKGGIRLVMLLVITIAKAT